MDLSFTMKSDVKTTFTQFLKLIENQFGTRVRAVQCDNGGYFFALKEVLTDLGIVMRFSCPHTHRQNGLV